VRSSRSTNHALLMSVSQRYDNRRVLRKSLRTAHDNQLGGSRIMEVTVYMEHGSCATEIAKFIDEETYMVCVPALEALAKKCNSTISETLEEAA
jgi:hypothetical protein